MVARIKSKVPKYYIKKSKERKKYLFMSTLFIYVICFSLFFSFFLAALYFEQSFYVKSVCRWITIYEYRKDKMITWFLDFIVDLIQLEHYCVTDIW